MDAKTKERQQAGMERKKEAARVLWESRRTEIEWLYYDQNWSQEKIASYYNVSQTALSKALKRMKVQSRGRGRQGNLNGRYKDGTESTLYRIMIQKDKCSKCGSMERLVIHHKNGNHQDNHLENLQVLCESCHNRITKKLWWKMKKS